MNAADPRHERIIVLAPTGRDAQLARRELAAVSSVDVVANSEELISEMALGAGVVLLAEEALSKDLVRSLVNGLSAQGAWSDVPFVVLAGTRSRPEFRSGGQPRDVLRQLAALGNVTILDRPVAPRTLAGVVRVALDSRRRQYAMRVLHENLDALNRGKDQFLAMLGHELRNPLNAMTSALTLLQMPTCDEPRRARYHEMLRRQTGAMTRMLDDLLDVSRLSLGKLQLESQRLDLGELVRGAVDALQGRAQAARQVLAVDVAPGAYPVDGDPTRFGQIIANVVVNAIKYTPSGGRIDVGVRRDDVDVVVAVRDNGIGISAEMLPKVFELFTQVRDGAQGGLGLGLALVDSLVRMHGGRVTIASEGKGRGSVVEIHIPLAAARTAAEPGVKTRRGVAGVRVLLVEDDPDGREILREMLQANGHEVVVASNAEEGLREFEHSAPDLVLTDLALPGMDGYELGRRMRATCARAPYLVAVTGFGLPEDRRRTRDAGFDDHLVKPIDFALLDRIFEVVADRRATRVAVRS